MLSRPDSRSKRTRKAITDALMQLLADKSFQEITINDVCDLAEVSRPTFYSYFEDKYALLRCCLEDVKLEVDARAAARGASHRVVIEETVNIIEEGIVVFRNLFLGEVNRDVSDLVNSTIYEFNYNSLLRSIGTGQQNPAPPEITALFRAGGSIAIISWWVSQPDGTMSKQDLVEYLLELSLSDESGLVNRSHYEETPLQV